TRNIEDATANVSLAADDLASEAWAITDGGVAQQVASNVTLRESFGRSGVTGSYQSIKSATTLLNHAQRHRDDVAVPMVNPEWTIYPRGIEVGDIETGDLVEGSFDWGFGTVTVQRRVTSKTVSVDAAGTPTIGLGLA